MKRKTKRNRTLEVGDRINIVQSIEIKLQQNYF
jgi:hypothetical protein